MSTLKNIDELTGFIIGFTTGIKVTIKENKPLPANINEEVIAGLQVFTTVNMTLSGQAVIGFQLGIEQILTEDDSHIAKNFITVSFGPEGDKVSSSMDSVDTIVLKSTDSFKKSVRHFVEKFSDVFPV